MVQPTTMPSAENEQPWKPANIDLFQIPMPKEADRRAHFVKLLNARLSRPESRFSDSFNIIVQESGMVKIVAFKGNDDVNIPRRRTDAITSIASCVKKEFGIDLPEFTFTKPPIDPGKVRAFLDKNTGNRRRLLWKLVAGRLPTGWVYSPFEISFAEYRQLDDERDRQQSEEHVPLIVKKITENIALIEAILGHRESAPDDPVVLRLKTGESVEKQVGNKLVAFRVEGDRTVITWWPDGIVDNGIVYQTIGYQGWTNIAVPIGECLRGIGPMAGLYMDYNSARDEFVLSKVPPEERQKRETGGTVA